MHEERTEYGVAVESCLFVAYLYNVNMYNSCMDGCLPVKPVYGLCDGGGARLSVLLLELSFACRCCLSGLLSCAGRRRCG